ncbi:late embryogenis abundant protein 2-like [Diospyros lotus]|uniref:late embryogenis abundant protein 2-like n=1 Tax=Diospyros lotus TaxID=55363 RepID=UPI0022564580|nr:late embryogenis abundant protein 2-like [Diospyros lotus]
MARSFSNARFLSSLVGVETISVALRRRGYAAASQGVGLGSAAGAAMANKAGEDVAAKSRGAWVPDPVTGYYKPENQANQIDVAELREMLLKRNVRRH